MLLGGEPHSRGKRLPPPLPGGGRGESLRPQGTNTWTKHTPLAMKVWMRGLLVAHTMTKAGRGPGAGARRPGGWGRPTHPITTHRGHGSGHPPGSLDKKNTSFSICLLKCLVRKKGHTGYFILDGVLCLKILILGRVHPLLFGVVEGSRGHDAFGAVDPGEPTQARLVPK